MDYVGDEAVRDAGDVALLNLGISHCRRNGSKRQQLAVASRCRIGRKTCGC